jgi:hypothetical protein
MSTIDIRKEAAVDIFAITFEEENVSSTQVAYKLERYCGALNGVKIHDGNEYVVVHSKEHAENLRKALRKAEELGWLK